MTPKNILIISRSFYPQNSPRANRTTELVKAFAKQGHAVTLLSPKGKPEHFEFEKEFKIKFQDLGENKLQEIKLFKTHGKLNILNRALFRFLSIFFNYPDIGWAFKVRNAIKRNVFCYDLMISIAVPHAIHWGVAWMRKQPNDLAKIWVADCGDPFMGATSDTYKPAAYFSFIEKYWCKKADYISVPFEGAKKAYYKEFYNKLQVIPQGFNFDEYKIDFQVYSPNPIITFAYAGSFIRGVRDPEPLINYLNGKNIPYKFIIYTNDDYVRNKFKNDVFNKIELRNFIPRKNLLQELSKMDFLVNFNNKVKTQLPSKLIDYYLANRPILNIDSYQFNVQFVDEFVEGNYKNRQIFENPEIYRIENITKAFLNLC